MASRGAYGKGYSVGLEDGKAMAGNSATTAIVAGIISTVVGSLLGFIFGKKTK